MAFDFKFPDVGEGIHEGRIVEWLVKEGDAVAIDQPFVKVETDKAVVDLPAPIAGTVLKLLFKAGDTIHVGDVIATFGEKGEKAAAPKAVTAVAVSAKTAAPDAAVPSKPAAASQASANARPLATPHTRALARKLGVDLASITPSGNHGRITDEDVERAASGPAPTAPRQPQAPPLSTAALPPIITGDGEIERVSVSHLRKVIAEAMALSKRTAAHVTHVDEADVTELMELYSKTKPALEAQGMKFSILPYFIKAAIAALKSHPLLNSSYDEKNEQLIIKKFYNIGLAVDTQEGLVVPVLKNADKKDMTQIAREVSDLAQRARERKLGLDEIRGASFTITNIGPIGGVFATPIIHQPEMAILGLHTIKERPAVVNGQIMARKMMYLSVSFDHRFVDGAEAARFMADLVRLVENPLLLMATI